MVSCHCLVCLPAPLSHAACICMFTGCAGAIVFLGGGVFFGGGAGKRGELAEGSHLFCHSPAFLTACEVPASGPDKG